MRADGFDDGSAIALDGGGDDYRVSVGKHVADLLRRTTDEDRFVSSLIERESDEFTALARTMDKEALESCTMI